VEQERRMAFPSFSRAGVGSRERPLCWHRPCTAGIVVLECGHAVRRRIVFSLPPPELLWLRQRTDKRRFRSRS
jgi:hypothetical protein